MKIRPIERAQFDIPLLMEEHPPVFRDRNKQTVFEIACPDGCRDEGTLGYVRWPLFPLPERVDPALVLGKLEARPTIYDYAPADLGAYAVEWHVNFADRRLFFGYGTGLFAQDEMQVAEHPALGALVEALRSLGQTGVTEEDGRPTPVLVTGVPRRCWVKTDPDEAAGRPRGLYGNEFSAASAAVVREATVRLEQRTVTNIIAILAPSYGVGHYTRGTIEQILITAYTGFRAALAESLRLTGPVAATVVHTGYWGCGVFGGNRVLMSLLQILAAQMAGVDRLVFHTVSAEGGAPFDEAVRIVTDDLAQPGGVSSAELLDRIVAMGFEWGMTNGS